MITTFSALPLYVMERITNAILEGNMKRVKMLLYLAYMIIFRNLREGQLNHKMTFVTSVGGLPLIVEQSLYDRFTEQHDGRRKNEKR